MRGTLHRGGGGVGGGDTHHCKTSDKTRQVVKAGAHDGLLVKDSAGEDEKMSVCHYLQKMFFDGVNVLD